MNFCVETCDVSSFVPRRILWLGERRSSAGREEGFRVFVVVGGGGGGGRGGGEEREGFGCLWEEGEGGTSI